MAYSAAKEYTYTLTDRQQMDHGDRRKLIGPRQTIKFSV